MPQKKYKASYELVVNQFNFYQFEVNAYFRSPFFTNGVTIDKARKINDIVQSRRIRIPITDDVYYESGRWYIPEKTIEKTLKEIFNFDCSVYRIEIRNEPNVNIFIVDFLTD